MKLAPLLKAKRADLLDGFPFKTTFKALSAKGSRSFKFDYLNSLLVNENIELVLTKDESFLPGLENSGICDATINSDSSIEVKVTKAFLMFPVFRHLSEHSGFKVLWYTSRAPKTI